MFSTPVQLGSFVFNGQWNTPNRSTSIQTMLMETMVHSQNSLSFDNECSWERGNDRLPLIRGYSDIGVCYTEFTVHVVATHQKEIIVPVESPRQVYILETD